MIRYLKQWRAKQRQIVYHLDPFGSTLTLHRSASALAKRGAELRRASERERLIATTEKLCSEMGKPLPEALNWERRKARA